MLFFERLTSLRRYLTHTASMAYLIQSVRVLDWERRGKPLPPPHAVKQRTVKQYAKASSIHTFVETGTYRGQMVSARKKTFRKIISIELSHDLFERARSMFSADANISIIQGDSSALLRDVLIGVNEPCLFWLDAHYSDRSTAMGPIITPIIQELHHILTHPVKGHVILVDDARLFLGRGGYPSIEEVRDLVVKMRPGWSFSIKDDIIRIHA